MEKMIEEAKKYAYMRHSGQMYSGDKEYSFHLEEVVALAKEHGLSDSLIVCAYLHDVIEDCFEDPKEGLADIKSKFGERPSQIVWNVSGFGLNRKEKTTNILSKIIDDEDSINVKICDRICNLKNSIGNEKKIKMYLKESVLYENVFIKAKPTLYKLHQETLEYLNEYQNRKKFNI